MPYMDGMGFAKLLFFILFLIILRRFGCFKLTKNIFRREICNLQGASKETSVGSNLNVLRC